MIRRLYQAITGQPWTTTRSATVEFGPPPGKVYADQLAVYTDQQLIRDGTRILAEVRRRTGQPTRPAATSTGPGDCERCQATGTVLHPETYRTIACPECRPHQFALQVAP